MSVTLEEIRDLLEDFAEKYGLTPAGETENPYGRRNEYGGVQLLEIEAYRADMRMQNQFDEEALQYIDEHLPRYYIWKGMEGLTEDGLRQIYANAGERRDWLTRKLSGKEFFCDYDHYKNPKIPAEGGVRVPEMVCPFQTELTKPMTREDIVALAKRELEDMLDRLFTSRTFSDDLTPV